LTRSPGAPSEQECTELPIAIDIAEDNEAWSLEQYVEHLAQAKYDLASEADLVASAPYLHKLNNNKDFFLEQVFSELKSVADFQRQNFYGSQVFLLHTSEKCFLRANVWRPISALERSINGFQYDVCHDHNFHILTAGYFGPGYRSRAYVYDRSKVTGLLGEQADLVSDGIFELPTGKIALYRAKKDVHFQLPPESISISLNLIPRSHHINDLQFQFDEETSRIARYLQASGTELVVRMAGLIGDVRFVELLQHIARTHPSTQVRVLASLAECQIMPEKTFCTVERVKQSETGFGRELLLRELDHYGYGLRLYGDADQLAAGDRDLTGSGAGALGEIRTPDPRIRSPMLYPAELRARSRAP
jgi:hypothetical protein